jgi:CDP-glucose 4,6-dehydratase
MIESFWRGKRVFLTGHTGFKGGWLAVWLHQLGAQVCGYALQPETDPSFFDALKVSELLEHHVGDLADFDRLLSTFKKFQPDVVFHLAAQPLVRRSYREPRETFQTNVMGTANVLDCIRLNPVKASVFVTTDKCYENKEWIWGYRETDRLGGHDPYSNSKACSELVVQAYRDSFQIPALATARAGNVLGGGDWSEDRLLPDSVRSFAAKKPVEIRNPQSTRPWQHVVEPLRGYLMLAQACYQEGAKFSGAWNFGPDEQDIVPVAEVLTEFCKHWPGAEWKTPSSPQNAVHEATLLKLDCSKAKAQLNWQPRSHLAQCLRLTSEWYRAFQSGSTTAQLRELTLRQIQSLTGPA